MNEEQGAGFLLLGGEGFIGRNLADYFSQQGPCFSVGQEKSFFEKRGDVFIQADPYNEKIEGSYRAVIHLIDNKEEEGESFLEAEKRLLENIDIQKGAHLIVFSSAVVYANPDSPYGKRKLALEDFYQEYCEEHGIALTILRLFNTFGPYQLPYRQGSLVATLLYNFLCNKTTEINDMAAERDLLYSGDIPKFVEAVITKGQTGIFDMGSGQLVSVKDLLDNMGKALGNKVPIIDKQIVENIPPRAADQEILRAENMVKLSEGLAKMEEFYKENLQSIQEQVERSMI